MRKLLAGSLLVVGLAVTSIVVATLDPVGAVSAAVSAKGDHAKERPLTQALDELVSNGTITQDQANAVQDGVKAKRRDVWARRPHLGKKLLDSIAQKLGVDTKELVGELRSGKSIADVARDKGVDPQSIVDEIVSSITGRIDQRVADGKMSQEQADVMKQNLSQRVTDFVNKVHGQHKKGAPPQGEQAPPSTEAAPPSTEAPSTTAPADTTPTTAPDTTTSSDSSSTTAAGGTPGN